VRELRRSPRDKLLRWRLEIGCPVAASLTVVASKLTMVIVREAERGKRRVMRERCCL